MNSNAGCSESQAQCVYSGTHKTNDSLMEASFTHCLAPGALQPDDTVKDAMRERIADHYSEAVPEGVLSTDIALSYQCSAPGTSTTTQEQYDSLELQQVLRKKMARSCAPSYDVSDASLLNKFTCHYKGPYIDDDGRNTTTRMQRSGRLMSCDASEEDRRKTLDDMINICHYSLGGSERNIDRSEIFVDVLTTGTL